MKNKKTILSVLLIIFCIFVLFSINLEIKKVSGEENIVRKFEKARDHLDPLLVQSCASTFSFDQMKEGLVPDIFQMKSDILFIITEFGQRLFQYLIERPDYNFAVIRLRSTNPVLVKYDVSALSIYLFLKKDKTGKIIDCYGKSFHQ